MQSTRASELPENPRQRAFPLFNLMFCYTMPTFFKGRKKTLEESDLYRALDEHRSDMLGNKLCQSWEKEVEKKLHKNKEPSLLKATTRVFGLRFAALGLLLFVLEIGFRVTQPLFLGALVKYYANPEKDNDNQTMPLIYALGIILCSAFNVIFMHPFMLGMFHTGMKIRIAMCSMIYRKALRLSKTALGDTTSGQVVNLISNDVGRLDTSVYHIHYLWLGPVETVIVTYLMYREIGPSSLFGVAFMALFLPLQAYLGKRTSVLRLRTALRTDERVRLMNEIISGIQVIKMYAWEIPFGKVASKIRLNEMNAIRKVNYIRGLLQSFIIFMTRVSVFISLAGYVLLGKVLTPQQAFVVTAYYNILRMTMTVYFPSGISQVAETLVSFRRIQKYMLYEETKVPDKSDDFDGVYNKIKQDSIIEESGKPMGVNGVIKPTIPKDTKPLYSEHSIEMTNLCARWTPESQDFTLNNINLKIKPKSLVAIIGQVGAGKSSLIQAILGELPAESGSIKVNGTFSYASQEPWLFTGSIRQNILFGLPMDKYRYRAVVKKCALERDFELFPHGDRTIVGERGASLSGGQRARISLARAVYRKSDIYLLDDPLSAVDSHVGRHLFDQCMRGFLRDEIVFLVTHQLQFLEKADHIIVMDKGQIVGDGTYKTIMNSGLDFAQMLSRPEKNEQMPSRQVSRTSIGGSGDGDNVSESRILNRQDSRLRQNSVSSIGSSIAESTVDTQMQVQEKREEGKIGLKLYKTYLADKSSYFLLAVFAFFCIGAQIFASGGDYYLSYWVNKNSNNPEPESAFNRIVNRLYRYQQSRAENNLESLDIYIFTAIVVATVIFAITRVLIFFKLAGKSSVSLHNGMYMGVTRASMYFFNSNPSGRILNRFSKDLNQVDEILPATMNDCIQIFLAMAGIIIVISLVNPWFLLITSILALFFYFLRTFYLKTSREVKRLESVNRSPIYSHLGASLNGLSTIRAFGAQKILIAEFDNYQDLHSSGFYMFLSTSRAFGYWLDLSCVVYIAIITMSFFIFPPENGGVVGLTITQVMGITGMVQWGMRQSAELENNMTAVERLIEYEGIEPEGAFESKSNKKPPKTWPEEGKVVFDDLSLRYFPDPKSENVLKSLNFVILPMEKVGIVGRTGAGKSSLINALFRLSFNEGSIIIDSRDTKELGLHDLRSKISIIPQEPVLFSGTMRYNLDPFDDYSDGKLWEALEEVKMKQAISELPNGLQSKITEGGANFSVGQRQLVCLARAILRENKILVLDEATANVDPQTDALIQMTIRHKFKDCTVLTIAHRLNSVMDSDKVLVMEAGRVVEFGSPYELLTESKTKIFYGMVKQTGNNTYETLLQVAQKAHEEHLKAKKDS